MRFVKGLFKGLAVLLALLVLIGVGFYVSDPPYWQRVFTAPMGEVWRTEWYEPKERVPGNELPLPTGPAESIAPEALELAQKYVDETDSVAFLVWHKGALVYERYGERFDAATTTDPASAHKTVVGLLIGAAIADGLIGSLDTPAADFLPEWTDEARRKIRIRDLLTMSSGLQIVSGLNPTGDAMKLNIGFDIPGIVFKIPADSPPGTVFEYNNINSQLLGIILQRAAGKRYAEYLSERLWSRLGAGDASVWLDHEGGLARTFCCLHTTAHGWLRVGLLLLNDGRIGNDQIIPAEWVQAMKTPSETNPNYGYQVWLGSPPTDRRQYNSRNSFKAFHSEPFAAPDMVYIDGFGGQRVYVVPSQELVIVRTGRAQLEWDDAKLPNAILRGIRP